jgi:hypothetical protein
MSEPSTLIISYADTSTPPPEGEYRLLGQEHSGVRTWRVEDDGKALRITAIPLLGYYVILIHLVLASAAAIGLCYWLLPPQDPDTPGVLLGLVSVALTLIGAALWFWYDILRAHRVQRQFGPWLELDRERRLVLLPRHSLQIPLEQVVRVQEVTLPARPKLPRVVTELQLVHRCGSAEERIELILAGSSPGLIRGVTRALAQTGLLHVTAVHWRVWGRYQVDVVSPR